MSINFSKFVLNYLLNLYFVFLVFIIFLMVIFTTIDALFGSGINIAISGNIVSILMYGALFVVAASAIQWTYNLVQLYKTDLDKEVKSKWRNHMFLWGFLANADYYEAFIVEKNNKQHKKLRDFLRLRSVSVFRP
jgi:hypothetical protein